jgi:two-component SAPR family response regulator
MIADINMQPITGIEFLEQLKQHGCQVKNLALMSGWWSDSALEKAEVLQCEVLKKPYIFDDLKHWLNKCESDMDPEKKLWGDWFEKQR